MEENRSALHSSLALKLCAIFLALALGIMVLLNIYPVALSRDLVSANKRTSMLAQASVMSSALSALETLDTDGVYQAMELLDTTNAYRVIVTDESARILYDNAPAYTAGGRYALFGEVSLALGSKVVFYSKYADNAFLSHAAMPVVSGGSVIGAVFLSEYDAEQSALISSIRSTMFRLSILVGAGAAILGLIFARALTKRITSLVQAMNIVREGDYAHRIPVVGTDEVSQLTAEFNNMTDRLRQTEERRRRFVSDASHELKTPLASIRLLSDSIVHTENMDTDTMREFVTDIGAEADRLQRTTEKLLSLTKLDSAVESTREEVDLKLVAENTLRLLQPLAAELKVFLQYDLSEGCHILANADSIYQVILTWWKTASSTTCRTGMVKLVLTGQENQVHLVVADSGIGIPEEDLPHIFDRFTGWTRPPPGNRGAAAWASASSTTPWPAAAAPLR
jgi:signal transduction histidine kinase